MKKISQLSRFAFGFITCAVLVACWQQVQQPVLAQNVPESTQPLIALPDFSALVERTSPAVVSIEASIEQSTSQRDATTDMPSQDEQVQEFFKRFFGQPMPGSPSAGPNQPLPRGGVSYGSGFIISSDGYVLTNHHVIEGSTKIIVNLADGREMVAKLIGSDQSTDVAVLKINEKNLPVIKIGDSSQLKPGQWVVAIGSPFGFDHSVTAGIVSGLGRPSIDGSQRYVPFIQTDVAINRGNSGGPLLNTRAEVIGINSQIFSNSGGYMGVSFAIPIQVAMNAFDQIKATGSVKRGQLGVQVRNIERDELSEIGLEVAEGAFVANVQNGSPAAKAGIKAGDVILSFNGQKIVQSSDLPPLVGALMPGVKTQLTLFRNGQRQNIQIVLSALNETIAQQPKNTKPNSAESTISKLGLKVEEVNASTRNRLGIAQGGVQIAQVMSPALNQMGIAKGDVILQVGKLPVNSVSEFTKALSIYKTGDRVRILVQNVDSTGIYVVTML
jgi:serine protease Do